MIIAMTELQDLMTLKEFSFFRIPAKYPTSYADLNINGISSTKK